MIFNFHRLIPRKFREALLSASCIRHAFRLALGGLTVKRTWVGNTFHFNGYRNFGFWSVDLNFIETEQRALAKRELNNGKAAIIYDIGANVGFWTLWLYSTMQKGSSIVAFEPDPDNLQYLTMNITMNALERVVVAGVALSDHRGNRVLHCDETGAMNTLNSDCIDHDKVIVVNTMSMDDAAEIYGVPDFVKIDVEGHEYEVLKGARNVLAKGQTIIILEVTRNGEEVINFLRGYDYVITNMQGIPVSHSEYYIAAYPKCKAPAC